VRESFPNITSYIDTFLAPSAVSIGGIAHTNGEIGNHSKLVRVHTHFAPIFGLVCKLLNISMGLTDRVFLRMFLRDLVSAGIRLNLIGPIEGVRLQAESFHKLEQLLNSPELCDSQENSKRTHSFDNSVHVAHAVTRDVSTVRHRRRNVNFYLGIAPVQSAPVIDTLQSRHDVLYSRLFNS
jgi:urease accessory protein